MEYIPGEGNFNSKIMIVGECPSLTDVSNGKLFSDTTGRALDDVLNELGLSRSEIWLSAVSKYHVPYGEKKIPFSVRAKNAGVDISEQLTDLQAEVNNLKPNVIIALGSSALWALTGKTSIQNYRGSILMGMGRKVVPTYNPGNLLNQGYVEFTGYYNKQVIHLDFLRAIEESVTPEFNLPIRNLGIIRNSGELYTFIKDNQDKGNPAIDIEAANTCMPVCVGISFHPSMGRTVPLWNFGNISSIPTSDLVQCWILLNDLLSSRKIIGQNFKYDHDKLYRLGFDIRGLASDTLLKSFAIHPELPKRLAFNQSIYTREPFYKDEGMYEGSLTDLFIGCARDACVTKEIDMAMDKDLDSLGMRGFYENFILPLHDLYLSIEQEGYSINKDIQAKLMKKYIDWNEELSYKLYQLVGDTINTNSPKQVAQLLFQTLKLPYRKGTSEEELTSLINLKKVSPLGKQVCSLILEKRRVQKTISTYLMALPDFDGKMKTTCFICLETGRTNTGQQEPPIRPQVTVTDANGKKKKRNLGMAFQTITKHGDIGQDVRSMFVPEPGWVFVNIDSSQAEARVTALLAEDDDYLAMFGKHDIHALTASWFFGGTEEDYSKKVLGYEHPIRFVGKTLRHAGERGAKGRRAAIEVNTAARKYKIDVSIDEAKANEALAIFHMKSPKIKNIYFREVIEALQRNRKLIAPLPYGIDAPHGGVRTFFERWGDELFRQAFSYIPQRAVTDNTKNAMLRSKKIIPDLRILTESHDAILTMIREKDVDSYAPILKQEMERPIDFTNCTLSRRKLSIPAELEYGYNLMDFKKLVLKDEFCRESN